MIDIKDEAELRHAFAHVFYAIEALVEGCPLAAQAELDSVKELVFWADDSYQGIEADLARREKRREEKESQEELQGQEVVQGQGEVLQGQGEEDLQRKEIERIAAELARLGALWSS